MHKRLQLLFIVSITIIGCAQVRSISGGEKDTTPPTILSTQPVNNCLRFSQNSFTLFFDEFIQLRDLQKELLVSPPLKYPPIVKIHQRSLEVSWKDTLAPSATYIFQFGNAIADLNESNVLRDVSFVFSTGNALDSLELQGKVTDAFADKPAASMKVLLFDSLSEVLSGNARPAYFARTNEQGDFHFRYLRNGNYVACALSDENNNNRYDIGESIDWLENVVPGLPSDSSSVKLCISIPRDTVVRSFNYTTDESGTLKFRFDPWLSTPRVRSLSSDSIVQWVVKDTLYAAAFEKCTGRLSAEVSVENNTLDTLEIEREANDQSMLKVRHSIAQKQRPFERLTIHAQRPIVSVDDSRLACYCDSTALVCKSALENAAAREIVFDKKPGKSYRLLALPGWVTDDCGSTNDTLRITFSVYDSKDLGTLRIKAMQQFLDQPHTFTLLDRSKNIVFETTRITSPVWIISDLVPGEYSAVIGIDQNGNGIIEPLSINPSIKTERNLVYPGSIQVRPNWELVVEWPAVRKD